MKRVVTVVTVAVLALGACKTFDPFTGEEKYGSTTKGAAIGAGAGAVIGAISGKDAQERRKRALIGAGVGLLAGGAVAQYLISKDIKQERIITIGGGENHPVARNDTEAGRAQNRRVELTLLPLKQ